MDAFSIATGAAGLASLGITLCDGVISYCRSYQSRGDDLLQLSQEAESLQKFLRLLEERQPGPTATPETLRSTLQDSLDACKLCMQGFETLHAKQSQQVQSPSLKNQGKSVVKGLQYPFQKLKFDGFRRQFSEFYTRLSAQVLLLSYDLTNDLHRLTLSESRNLSSVISAQGTEILQEISGLGPTMTQMFDQRMAMQEEFLKKQLTKLEERMLNSMPRGKLLLPAQDAKLGSPPSSQDSVGFDTFYLPSESPEKRQVIAVPSICDLTQATDGENALSMTGERLLDVNCHCTRNRLEAHSRTCFYSLKSRKRRVIVGQVRLFDFLLQCKITVQYSRHAFYRELGISPNFTLRATGTDSVALHIIMDLMHDIPREKPEELTKILRTCLISLRQSFIDGHAWPTNTWLEMNLLHWACLQIQMLATDKTAATFCQFLVELIGLGVPINDGDTTPLSQLLDLGMTDSLKKPCSDAYMSGVSVIARELIKHGAEFSEDRGLPLDDIGGIDFLPLRWRAMIGLPIPLSYGDLARAILQESEADVRRLLSTTKSFVLEKAEGGESPLHLSVPWTRGLELLLELGGDAIRDGIDAEDELGGTPLDYALHLGLYESAKLLLNANAWIDIEHVHDIETNRGSEARHSDETVSFLCQLLASRRKELSSIALEWMTNEEATTFNLQRHQLLQEEAFDVSQALQKRHIDIPDYFQNILPGSIYHYHWMNLNLAEALFRAGFDHTNVYILGFSPLMTTNLLELGAGHADEPCAASELVKWFVNHGANLCDLIPDSAWNHQHSSKSKARGFRLIHRVSYVIGREVWAPWRWRDGQVCFQQGLQMLHHPVRDSCKCFCARGGCSPASSFARGTWEREEGLRSIKNWGFHPIRPFRGAVQYFPFFGIARETPGSIVSEMIRASTFASLGMKHTCCRYTHRCYGKEMRYPCSGARHVADVIMDGEFQLVQVMEDNEIAEIQDEDKHLAARLDTLVEEFEAKFEELGQSFVDFFKGYWWERMYEIENEADELSREDVEAIQDTGVILEVREEGTGL